MAPQILFLDEPTSSLDPSATRVIEGFMQRCSHEGITLVMSTHDLGQARRLADRVAFIDRGRLLEHGSSESFFEGPSTSEAQAFLAGRHVW